MKNIKDKILRVLLILIVATCLFTLAFLIWIGLVELIYYMGG